MHELRALRVAGENDLGAGTASRSLLSSLAPTSMPIIIWSCRTYGADKVGHSSTSRRVTTLQEPTNARRVRNTLNSKAAGTSNPASNLVEKQRADSSSVSNVALLSGTAGVDHADGAACGAVGELVVAAAAVLALGESVFLGTEVAGEKLIDREGFCIGGGSWSCESARKEGESEECKLHVG